MKKPTVVVSLVLLVGVVHLGGCGDEGGGSSSCGPNACGACQSGYTNVDVCRDGEWDCSCVPLADASADAKASDGGSPGDCGPSPCGACQSGYKNVDVCEQGTWRCSCVPDDAGAE